eukprot:GSChrysophyteH1.ASY1.ANO1.1558.1 assembled CDS
MKSLFPVILYLFVTAAVLSIVVADEVRLGFGINRLIKRSSSHSLHLATPTDCSDVEQYWFSDAVIDNFSSANDMKKWSGKGQRFWLNKKFWEGSNAPIFVFIGGEGEESCARLSEKMYMYDLAQEHGALMVNVEHRFYGESMPLPTRSTDNLRFLSSDQALADLANVIIHIKKTLNSPNSRIITVGGSYPGNLSAWFRLKYPSITHGSIASSAPVTAKVNFAEYMDVVGESIRYFSGSECYDALQEGAQHLALLTQDGFGGENMRKLEKDFRVCGEIRNKWDLAVFYSNIMGNLQGTVQYNNEHMGVFNITDVCRVMQGSEESSYNKLVKLSKLYLEQAGEECDDASYKNTIDYLASTSPDPSNAARPWVYQTCSEFGYYQTADSPNQPFNAFHHELSLDFSRKICFDAFDGWKSDPNVEFTNIKYGGTHIDASRIVFTSGSIDPWHALGVTNFTATLPQMSEQPVYIRGTAHCNDLYAPNAATDPESLVHAREIVAEKVTEWLR